MKTKLFFFTITLFFSCLLHSQGIWITNDAGCKFLTNEEGSLEFYWDGNCVNNLISGTGTLNLYENSYDRNYVNNRGPSKLIFSYKGNTLNGKLDGKGIYTWANGNKYIGEFQNGERNGLGTIELNNGEKFTVKYKNDRLVQDKTIVDKLQTNDFTLNFIEWFFFELKSNTGAIIALNKDIFDCYTDLSKYDTPLKRKLFTQSKGYSEVYNKYKLDQLTYLNNSYYYFNLENWEISNYDMAKGAFEITFNDDQIATLGSDGSLESQHFIYKPVNIFCIKSGEFYLSIPTIPVKKRIYTNKYNFRSRSVSLSIKVDKSTALEIENNRKKLDIYFITLSAIKKGNIYNDNLSIWIKPEDKNLITGYYIVNKARLVIANKETGEIYYSKLYVPAAPIKKIPAPIKKK